MKSDLKKLFDSSIIGMVHLKPLPGVPGFQGIQALVDAALNDVRALIKGGVDSLLIENMNDFPCLREKEMGPEVAAAMTRCAVEVRKLAGTSIPIGIQVLFAAHKTAIAVAQAAELNFIRAESWTYGHLADKGWAEASAGPTVRYQKLLEAEGISVLADIKKKHASHSVTADLTIEQVAANMSLQKADAVVVTGHTTGDPPSVEELRAVRRATSLPVVIGSGLTEQNVSEYVGLCDAMIVGSSLKHDGDFRNEVCPDRTRRFVDRVTKCRE